MVFYVDVNNTLASLNFTSAGESINIPSFNASYVYPVLPGSRSLSVQRFSQENNTDEVFLFYENPSKNITMLHGSFVPTGDETGPLTGYWTWSDSSSLLYPSDITFLMGGWISAPFATYTSSGSGSTWAYFFNPQSNWNSSAPTGFAFAFQNLAFLSKLRLRSGLQSLTACSISRSRLFLGSLELYWNV